MSVWPTEKVDNCPWGYNERCPKAGTCRDTAKAVSYFTRCYCLVPNPDGQSEAGLSAEQGPGPNDSVVADSD